MPNPQLGSMDLGGGAISSSARSSLIQGPPVPVSAAATPPAPQPTSQPKTKGGATAASNIPGAVAKFTISVAAQSPTGVWAPDPRYAAAQIEMAPARKSYYDKQAQGIPGAEAGIEHVIHANLVRLAVPASRSIYQHLGIKDELLEWVGAFVGYDNDIITEQGVSRKVNAWAEFMDVKNVFRPGREVIINLEWGTKYAYEFGYNVGHGDLQKTKFRGLIKYIDAVYATEQRIYYRVCLEVTNREDLRSGSKDGTKGFPSIGLPDKPVGSLVLDKDAEKARADAEAKNKADTAAKATESKQKAVKEQDQADTLLDRSVKPGSRALKL